MGTVRDMAVGDAHGVAEVHVRAWQRAYRGGLMPDAYLDTLSVEERAATWANALSRASPPRRFRLVAVDEAGVRAFLCGGEALHTDAARDLGEVYVLNVHPDAWGAGHGRALMSEATKRLVADGFRRAVLWVHPANARARRFYEGLGWDCEGTVREDDVLGVTVPAVRYERALGEAS